MASIQEAAEQLSEKQEKGIELSQKFEEVEGIETGPVIKEGFLKKQIETEIPGKVAGVDGGIVQKRYSAADVAAVRAVAAVFTFENSKLADTSYLPGRSEEPEYHVFDSVNHDGLERNTEAKRLEKETEVGLEALTGCDKVLMDGSIVPSYSEADSVINNYNRLFGMAGEGDLIGVVEDSYGQKMTSLLEEKLGIKIGNVRDTLVMDELLGEGERSFVRKYAKGPAEHPVLQKLVPQDVNKLHTFYVKLSSKDLPLRIDYYGSPEHADQIAGILDFLKTSKRYTVPSPIVEADKLAKIPEKYLKRLEKKFSPEMRRRDRRTF